MESHRKFSDETVKNLITTYFAEHQEQLLSRTNYARTILFYGKFLNILSITEKLFVGLLIKEHNIFSFNS